MALTWQQPVRLPPEGPHYPYTHWWLDQEVAPHMRPRPRPEPEDAAGDAFSSLPSHDRTDLVLMNVAMEETIALFLDADNIDKADEATHLPIDAGPPIDIGLRKGDAIVAAIDDGAFFAHQRLWHAPRKTRVVWAWLQGAAAPATPHPKPDGIGLPFGREFFRDDIDTLMEDHKRGDGVDEHALYTEAGLIDLTRRHPQSAARRISHGMAVMDLLAGSRIGDPGHADALRLHPMCVSLPPRVTFDTSGSFIALFAMLAVDAILNRAFRMISAARPLDEVAFETPVVVNLSYGLTAGPKDGNGLFERYLNSKVEEWNAKVPSAPLTIFTPMGNHRQSQTHARLSDPGTTPSLAWRLLPDDSTPSFLEVWGAPRPQPPDRPTLWLSLTPPGVKELAEMPKPPGFFQFCNLLGGDGLPLGRAYFLWVPASLDAPRGPGRETVVLVMRPTIPPTPGHPFVRPGTWALRVRPEGDSLSWPIDIFVQRDDSLPGYRPRGRQTWLSDPTYRRTDPAGRPLLGDPSDAGPVQRAGTYNALASGPLDKPAPATGPHVRLVAGTRMLRGKPQTSIFSGAGFAPEDAVGGLRSDPDAFAPAEGSPASPGLIVSGALSGSRVLVRGTSFASPAAARAFALASRGTG